MRGPKKLWGLTPYGQLDPQPLSQAPEGSEAPLLVDPADTDDEKAWWDAFQLIMQGFHAATCTLSDHYQLACKEVEYCTEVHEEVHCNRPYICVGGLGHHTLMGVGHTASHELYGRVFGGAGTLAAGSPASWKGGYGVHFGLASCGREPVPDSSHAQRRSSHSGSTSNPDSYGESHCGCQHPDVGPGALACPATTSWSLLSFPPPGNVLLPAGDGWHGPKLPCKLASFSG